MVADVLRTEVASQYSKYFALFRGGLGAKESSDFPGK